MDSPQSQQPPSPKMAAPASSSQAVLIQTIERLIQTVARAFYDDEVVMVVDVLVRERFLRDDTMSSFLHLGNKKIRSALQFLMDERIVQREETSIPVPVKTQPGKVHLITKKCWFIDYNLAAQTIRLRLHLMQQELRKNLDDARSVQKYLCPGWATKRCNGYYIESDMLNQPVDPATGHFLCGACSQRLQHDPSFPTTSYTLEPMDNSAAIASAEEALGRFNRQLHRSDMAGEKQRDGIFDLLHEIFKDGNPTIPSNLPSDNIWLLGFDPSRGDGVSFLNESRGEIKLSMEESDGNRAYLRATGKWSPEDMLQAAAHRCRTRPPLEERLAQQSREQQTIDPPKHRRTQSDGGKMWHKTGIAFLDENNKHWSEKLAMVTEHEDGGRGQAPEIVTDDSQDDEENDAPVIKSEYNDIGIPGAFMVLS